MERNVIKCCTQLPTYSKRRHSLVQRGPTASDLRVILQQQWRSN